MKKKSFYVHIPFCDRKCFYCSFPVIVGQAHRVEKYLRCVLKELSLIRQSQTEFLTETLYWGGGTPSFLGTHQGEFFMRELRQQENLTGVKEFTLEVNPEGLTRGKLFQWQEWGVHRLSLGAQTFSEDRLQFLGRAHTAKQIYASFDMARQAGFRNINLDVMMGFPQQSNQELLKDLNEAAALDPEHISLYALAVEPRSRFYANKLALDSNDVIAELYSRACLFLEERGYRLYEVSNFAKPGFESQHNKNYWAGGNYLGLGVGAHSHFEGHRWWNVENFFDYIKIIESGCLPRIGEETLTSEVRLREAFLMGLRRREGVDLDELEERFGCFLKKEEKEFLNQLFDQGLLEKDGRIVRTTASGRLVLDEIAPYFVCP